MQCFPGRCGSAVAVGTAGRHHSNIREGAVECELRCVRRHSFLLMCDKRRCEHRKGIASMVSVVARRAVQCQPLAARRCPMLSQLWRCRAVPRNVAKGKEMQLVAKICIANTSAAVDGVQPCFRIP